MNVEEVIVEIEQDLAQYKSSGLIDRVSMYRWAAIALKRFGQSICVPTEKVVHVKNGKASLPSTFHSLIFAVKCTPKGYQIKEKREGTIQNSLMWTERVERSTEWNTCEPCCVNETEKVIVENIYMDDDLVSFYYEQPTPLKLGKYFKKTSCTDKCRNLLIKNSPYEITINETTLFANFDEGTIYLEYYGIEEDDKGIPLIPETPRGELSTYIEYYLKKRLFEKLISNSDDPNIGNLFQYYVAQEAKQFILARGDAKMMTLTPDSYKKLALMNRVTMNKVKFLLPNF